MIGLISYINTLADSFLFRDLFLQNLQCTPHSILSQVTKVTLWVLPLLRMMPCTLYFMVQLLPNEGTFLLSQICFADSRKLSTPSLPQELGSLKGRRISDIRRGLVSKAHLSVLITLVSPICSLVTVPHLLIKGLLHTQCCGKAHSTWSSR